jgi:hypothetical protein
MRLSHWIRGSDVLLQYVVPRVWLYGAAERGPRLTCVLFLAVPGQGICHNRYLNFLTGSNGEGSLEKDHARCAIPTYRTLVSSCNFDIVNRSAKVCGECP